LRQLPYAFGGAIALNYHREPPSTLDIDINVFVTPEQDAAVLEALGAIYNLEGQERAVGELRQEGQARTLWGDTFVDLFLANTDFHGSMAANMQTWLERFLEPDDPRLGRLEQSTRRA